jgi:hypothetical protein
MAGMPGPPWIRRGLGPRWPAAAAVVTALVLLAGCTSSGSPDTSPSSGTRLAAALAHWASFPVGAQVRPVVIDPSRQVAGPASFPSQGVQDAFDSGAITLPRSLPANPGRLGSYSLISAGRAAQVLTGGASRPASSTRVTVTQVKLTSGIFATDRGRQTLPAWQFTLRGVASPANVLAVATAQRFWPSRFVRDFTTTTAAQAGRSGRALTLTVYGAPAGTGACQASYSLRQRGSAQAVAIDVTSTVHFHGQNCSAAASPVTLPLRLPAPLGNRVLVDAQNSAPIPVTQPLVSSS